MGWFGMVWNGMGWDGWAGRGGDAIWELATGLLSRT